MAQNYTTTNPIGAERNIFGRSGRLYKTPLTKNAAGVYVPGTPVWMATVTEISATITIDRMEVRRAGSYGVGYKPGEITGEGSLTFDYINSEFTQEFIDYVNSATNGPVNMPVYNLMVQLGDPGQPGITYGNQGNPTAGMEQVILKNVTFWSLPLGYSMSDMVTRDMDFTFSDIAYGGTTAAPALIDETP